MDDIYYEKILNRIIQGRLRIKLGDLILFIYEPDSNLIEESFDIYQETYDKAFFGGAFVDREILEVLVENDLWSPINDKTADDLDKKIEDLKVEAFKSYYNKKKLEDVRRQIRQAERSMAKHRYAKKQLDHVSCKGAAAFSRQCWMLAETTKNTDGSLYDFKNVSISYILDIYAKEGIDSATFRKIARSDPWRSMWHASIKQGNAFGKRTCDLDKNQLALISFSQMYDNVYESPEAPKSEVMEDDDCLDGWFIQQRREQEKNKKEKERDDLLSNPKIANSQEVFLMADSKEHANEIYGLNNGGQRGVIRNREKQIKEHVEQTGDNLHFKELSDVKSDRVLQATTAGINKIKGR